MRSADCPLVAKVTSNRAAGTPSSSQPDWLALSTWVVAVTSTSARETTFRPPVEVHGRRTLVMCDQIATVDLNHLAEPAGFLPLERRSESTKHSHWCSICDQGGQRPRVGMRPSMRRPALTPGALRASSRRSGGYRARMPASSRSLRVMSDAGQ